MPVAMCTSGTFKRSGKVLNCWPGTNEGIKNNNKTATSFNVLCLIYFNFLKFILTVPDPFIVKN